MNPDDVIPDTPLAPACVVVDALLDGETVDKQTLRDALEDPAARAYFVDALVLRQLTHEMAPTTFAAAVAASGRKRQPLRWLVSAAVLALVAAGGFVAGHRHDAAATMAESTAVPDAGTAAPVPTKVIRLEPGVSWTTDAEK
jgi:hypothetical protein